MAEDPAGPGRAAGAPDSEALLAVVRDVSAELHPSRGAPAAITLDSTLDRDLGLDSLSRVELVARAEDRFGVTLPEHAFAEIETPRDLWQSLSRAAPAASRGGTAREPQTAAAAAAAGSPPHAAASLPEVLDHHAQADPDRVHIRLYDDAGPGETITYGELHEGAARIAGALQQRGLTPGTPVALMLPTGREYFHAFFGVLLAGGVPVPLYPPARSGQIEDHLRRQRSVLASCRAPILITEREIRRYAQLLHAQVDTLREVTTVPDLDDTAVTMTPGIDTDATAFLQYTSGSTGDPKGVVLSHANLLANIRAMGRTVGASSEDVFVSWLPLYHDMGLIGAWLGSLYYAAPLVVMSPLAFIARPQRWLRAIHRHGGTLSAGPNFAYDLCLRRIGDEDMDGLDLSRWRVAFNGAEPVSPATMARFCERFAGWGFRREAMTPVYGLAECSVGLAFPALERGPVIDRVQRDTFTSTGEAVPADADDANALEFVSCGVPLPGHEVRIADTSARELPERHEGRIEFRGPSATSGYYRHPEATRQLLRDGWLDSGDRGYVAEGDLYVTGRTKDIIIRAGRNLYPQELEDAVGELEGVRKGNVAVFASNDPETGVERLVVAAETRRRDEDTRTRLSERINEIAVELTGTPADDVRLTPPNSVPKTSSGKIRRAGARELYEGDRLGRTRRRGRLPAVWRQIGAGIGPTWRRARRALVERAFAAYAWTVYGVLAPFVWLGALALPRLEWRFALMRAAGRLAAAATRIPIHVRGLEHLPREAPCVIVSNHASYLDVYVLATCLPRPLSFVAKGELAASPVTRWPLARIGCHFVERGDKRAGAQDARRLAASASRSALVFFPEGTFTRMPGLLPFHMGAFVAAVDAGVPVVPVALRGTRSILRSGSWFPRRGAVTVTVGEPIAPGDGERWGEALALRDAARELILRHCGEPDLSHERAPI